MNCFINLNILKNILIRINKYKNILTVMKNKL